MFFQIDGMGYIIDNYSCFILNHVHVEFIVILIMDGPDDAILMSMIILSFFFGFV